MGKWGFSAPAICLYMCTSGAFDRNVRFTGHLHTERYNALLSLFTIVNCVDGERGKEVKLGHLGRVE